MRSQVSVSERRACSVLGQPRATQRRHLKVPGDEVAFDVRLATQYGRYGYRRIRRLLLDEGWQVSVKRVYRIWRREGLKVPKKQPKRARLWLNDGSCMSNLQIVVDALVAVVDRNAAEPDAVTIRISVGPA